MNRKRTWRHTLLLPMLLAASGCGAMSQGGESAQEVFPDPKVYELIKATEAGDIRARIRCWIS
jgi:hypothetical protein